jgi:imidazoleglycerol phosphate dehydratase HisB
MTTINETCSRETSVPPRVAIVRRATRETRIDGRIDLDADEPTVDIATGIGMLDHLMNAFAVHAGIGLELGCDGDLEVDDHHVAEDCAIVLATLIANALGDRSGIERFGWSMVPLDESLCRTAIDLVRRPSANIELDLVRPSVGGLACENATHFLETLALTAPFTLHVRVLEGRNDHHKMESAFKSLAVAFRAAIRTCDRVTSTKGVL